MVTKRTLEKIRKTVLVAATATGAVATPQDPGDGAIDLTAALTQPDSFVSRVTGIPGGPGFVALLRGTGQSCYDGWLVRCDPSRREASVLVHLGEYGSLGRAGVLHSSPDLVATISNTLFLLNLACDSAFPEIPTHGRERGTGNVVLYDDAVGSFTNLTKASGTSGSFYRATGFFPEERVVVVERLRLSGSDEPQPEGPTLEWICMRLDGDRLGGPDTIPSVGDAWRKWHSVSIASTVTAEDANEWTVSWPESAGASEHFLVERAATPVKFHPLFFALDKSCSTLLVSDPAFGTRLLSAGEPAIQVSETPAFDYDPRTSTVFLRTRREGACPGVFALQLHDVEPMDHTLGPLRTMKH